MQGVIIQFIVACVTCLLLAGQAHAGAWNQNAGEGQIITTTHWARADTGTFDDPEDVVSDFNKLETRLWVEHGLSEDFTLVLNGALQQITYEDIVDEVKFEGFDDTEIGLQFEFASREGLATSLRASYVIDGQLDETAATVLSPGDVAELRFLWGQSRETSKGVLFHDTQLAVRSGSIQAVEQVQGAFTLGYKPSQRLAFMVQGFANHRFEFTEQINTTIENGIVTGVDRFTVKPQSQVIGQISAAWQYKPSRYIQVGGRHTLHGRNIVTETGLFVGLWTEY